jgi:hypothetical protein
MEINRETKVSINLSKEEVTIAVFEYLNRYGKIPLDEKIDKDSIIVNDVKKRVQEPGGDIHDCYWHEYFDGVEVTYKTN